MTSGFSQLLLLLAVLAGSVITLAAIVVFAWFLWRRLDRWADARERDAAPPDD